VGRWLVGEASDDSAVEATVFTNIAPGAAATVRGWVDAVRAAGFAVFAKPKIDPDDDIDDEMVAHIERRSGEGWLQTLVVASGDGRNFRELLERLSGEGTDVRVLGFEEHAGYATSSSGHQLRRRRGRAGRVLLAPASPPPREPPAGRVVAAAHPTAAAPGRRPGSRRRRRSRLTAGLPVPADEVPWRHAPRVTLRSGYRCVTTACYLPQAIR
jgi:hypothetical protein